MGDALESGTSSVLRRDTAITQSGSSAMAGFVEELGRLGPHSMGDALESGTSSVLQRDTAVTQSGPSAMAGFVEELGRLGPD